MVAAPRELIRPIDIAQFGCRAGLVRKVLYALVEFGKLIHGAGGYKVFSRARPILD